MPEMTNYVYIYPVMISVIDVSMVRAMLGVEVIVS